MFVFPYRIVLKTCGTTTLLNALPKILEIASQECNLTDVEAFFYNRKAFLFPEMQSYPHGKFGDEASFLDKLFPKSKFETSGYVVGKINDDHWCLYLATPINCEDDGSVEEDDDVTLEVMMHDLDKETMRNFWKRQYDETADRDNVDVLVSAI